MISEILLLASCSILGIFVGAQITEAILFVPHWKSMSPDHFFQQHKTFGKKIYQFFAPLTIAATIIPLTTVGYLLFTQSENKYILILMGMSTLMFFSTYFIYFKYANKSFAERSISNEDLPSELNRWGNWHWTRIIFELIAFFISLFLLLRM